MNLHRLFTSFSPLLHRSLYLTGFASTPQGRVQRAMKVTVGQHAGQHAAAVNVHDESIRAMDNALQCSRTRTRPGTTHASLHPHEMAKRTHVRVH
jgi:hypothetical protein